MHPPTTPTPQETTVQKIHSTSLSQLSPANLIYSEGLVLYVNIRLGHLV